MAETKPSRDEQIRNLVSALGAQSAPPAPTPRVGVGDYLREFAGGATTGTGGLVRGAGEFVETPNSGISAKDRLLSGAPARKAGDAISAYGQGISEGGSAAARAAKENSTPSGDLLSPSTWSLGKDPSLAGYGLHAANVIGQAIPTLATAVLSRGKVVPTMASAGASGGGAAAQQEQERLTKLPEEDLAKVPAYQRLVASGVSSADARSILAESAASNAFRATAPVSSASAFTEGLPITGMGQRALTTLVGRSRAARALTGGVVDAVGEGAQEVAEQAAQTAGANQATGENRSLTADSFQNFVLGTMGGGPIGAVSGLTSAPEAETASEPNSNRGVGVTEATPAQGAPAPGPNEAEALAERQPPAPVVTGTQPAFKAGAVEPQTGRVEVAPGVAVNPNDGALSKGLAQAAVRGEMDRAPTASLSDGTQFNPETGEITALSEPKQPPEKPKLPKPTPDQLDQVVLERLQAQPLMDGRTTAMVAKSLGVTLGDIAASKKRVRSFLEQQRKDNPGDTTIPKVGAADATQATQQESRPSVGSDAGVNAQGNGRNESADRAEAGQQQKGRQKTLLSPEEADTASEALATSLKKTDRAKGPDGATYMVKENANGEGYHVTRSEDGSTLQHRSTNPARPWSREEAVRAAADLARERVTTKESSDGNPPVRSPDSTAGSEEAGQGVRTDDVRAGSRSATEPAEREAAVRGQPYEVVNNRDNVQAEISANAVKNGVAASGVGGSAAGVQEARGQRVAQGGKGAAAPVSNARPDPGKVRDEVRGSTVWRLEGAAPAAAEGAARDGTQTAVRAEQGQAAAAGEVAAGVAREEGAGGVSVATESGRAAQNDSQERNEIASDRGRNVDAGGARGAAGGASSRVIRKDEATKRMRAAGMTIRQANDAFSAIGAKHLLADRRFEPDVQAKIDEFATRTGKIRTGEKVTFALDSDGNKGRGEVLGISGGKVQLVTEDGVKLTVNKENIKPEERIESPKLDGDAAVWDSVPTPSRRREILDAVGLARLPDRANWNVIPKEKRAALMAKIKEIQDEAESFAQNERTIRVGSYKGTYTVDIKAQNGATVSGEGRSREEALAAARKKVADNYVFKKLEVPAENRLVTDDVAAAARARLKEKLGRLSSGIDPTLLADGAILAVYHIERGARTFAAYARAMVDDLGDNAKQYLAAWYEGARRMPGMSTEGMTPTAEVDASQAAGIPEITTEEPNNEKAAQTTDEGGQQSGAVESPAAPTGSDGNPGDAAGADGEAGRRNAGSEAAALPEAEVERSGKTADGPVGDDNAAGIRRGVDDGGSEGPLAPAPADDVRPAEKQRATRDRPGRSRAADANGDEGTAGERDDAGGSVAGGARGIPDSGPASVQPSDSAVADAVASGEVSVQQPDGGRPRNFVIPPDFNLGAGGPKAKVAANIAAIETLKRIESEGRVATPAEQAVLAKYVGWGGVPQAFRHESRGITAGWERQVAALEAAMTPDELAAARRSTQDAHYTSAEVVGGIYDGLQRLGYAGGITLEPAMGTGNFLGLAPAEIRGAQRWKGVELDSITGRIAKQLYPEANIVAGQGFQDVSVPENYFDAVIGNPPFGRTTITDSANKDISGFSIHNFFFAKSLKGLKPGGIMAMVVSNSMLDKAGGKQRRWLADRANFVGAIRLPNTAFKANAGTEVTTDIVFLQKLRPGQKPQSTTWTEVGTVPDPAGGEAIPLNRYFVEHPEMMLGTMTREGKMRRAGEPTLSPRPGMDLAAALREATARLPQDIVQKPAPIEPGESTPYTDVNVDAAIYGHYVDGESIMQRLPDEVGERRARTVALTGRDAERVRGMIDLRDKMKALMRAEMSEAPKAVMDSQRTALNAAYDAFNKKFGYLNNAYNANLFRDDADAYRVRALEKNYQRLDSVDAAARGLVPPRGRSTVEVAEKADILMSRVFRPERQRVVHTASDALGVSLNTYGRVNIAAMADMLGKPQQQIVAELGDSVFVDPQSGYATADDYLSGNVKAKLAAAREAAKSDPSFDRNVRALEEVQPPDISPADIYVAMGSPWVPTSDYAAFGREIIGLTDVRLSKSTTAQKFMVSGVQRGIERFGTQRLSARDIFEKAVSNDAIQVFNTVRTENGEQRVLDMDATEAARAAAETMRQEFAEWIWKDQQRRERLSRIYNDTYNTDQPRKYDGAKHLTFPGKVDDAIISLRPTQLNAVWRMVMDGEVLLDHVVGAGKTYTAIAAIMKLRQMGLMQKPMVAVPNHLVQQWGGDFMRLYPAAKILAVTENDFTKDRRKLMFSRIATGDWDAVIVAHSQFTRIQPPKEFEQEYLQEQIDEYEEAMRQSRADGDRRTTKQIEQMRDQVREKLKKRIENTARDTDTAFFDEMGVDGLFIDEAHEFKNLGFATRKRNVSGMGSAANGGSKKAEDLFIKVRYVKRMNRGRGVNFLTGTPVSNSLAEMFTMQRYFAYDDMKARGVHLFDNWANTFAMESTEHELDSSGRGLKSKTVLKRFLNVPEMMQPYKRFADTITQGDLQRTYKESTGKDWPVPKIRGDKPQNIVVKPSPALLSYIENDIIPRMQAVTGERGEKPDPTIDNMLKITNDARLAALDVRLRDPEASDDPNSKPNQMIRRALDIYRNTKDDRGTQLIFCDLSTPKSAVAAQRAELVELQRLASDGDDAAQAKLDKMSPDDVLAVTGSFSVYDDVRAKLIAAGVPPREIAFIHDAKTDLQKKQLFDRVNKGDVRFLMGSTSKMGAGTNVQERLVALHHLDAPWRPSDLEQREGRIIRQGNSLYARDPAGFVVDVNRYATERTYDARMWQLIERKAAVVEQIRKADVNLREVDDVVGEAANAAEMKAAATGNPMLIEQVELQAKVKRLTSLQRSHNMRVYDAEAQIGRIQADGGPDGRHAAATAKAVAGRNTLAANPKDPFEISVGGTAYTDRKEGVTAFSERIASVLTEVNGKGRYKPVPVADYRGANLIMQPGFGGIDEMHVVYPSAVLGDIGFVMDLSDADGKVSGVGALTKVNNVIERMADWQLKADSALKQDVARLAELRDVAAQTFKQSDELNAAETRLREVNTELVKAVAPKPNQFKAVADDDLAPLVAAPLLRSPMARAIRAALRDAAAKLGSGVKVVVLDDGAQADAVISPLTGRSHAKSRGAVYRVPGGDTATIYLVASNLGSIEQARRTLAHEAIGHFGMEKVLGDNFARVADDALKLVFADPRYIEIRKRVAQYQPRGRDVMAKEALAMMAEGDYKNGLMARVYAAVRAWLRSVGLLDGTYTHEEIVALTVAAARNLSQADAKPVAAGNAVVDDDLVGQIESAAQSRLDKAGVANIGDRIRDKITDWKPSLLGALTLRQLADVSTDYLPQVGQYADVMTRMQTRRNQLQEESAVLAERWEKWQRKNREASATLADVMHDATLAGVDPDKDFVPGLVFLASGEAVSVTYATKTADELEDRAKTAPRRVAEILLRDAERLRNAAAAEVERARAYPALKQRFDAMPDEAKAIYREARDIYAKRADQMLQAVLGRIDSLEIPEEERVSMARQMRAHFESARVTAPYFPLARFGEYWVSAERDGEKEFRMVETRAAQKRLRAQLDAQGWKTKVGTKLDMTRATDGASSNFVAQVTTLLGEKGVNREVADEIYQLYLRTLPDLSVRKQFIHRKGTPGYDSDALRAFAAQSTHGAHQLARLEHGASLERLMRAMKSHSAELSSEGEDDSAVASSRMVNEMQKRHEWVMNPSDSGAVQKISAVAFAYYLAASPAAALVNLTQSYVTTFPVLAAKHGWARAMAEITRAMGQTISTYGHVEKKLSGDELRAHEELTRMGAIDRTLSHDLAGIGESSTLNYNPTWRRTMSIISHGFHKSEVFNREATGLAAYRMARADGASHADAVKHAADTIWSTHFDYSNANRARWVQSNVGKVLFSMKQYSQNMTYYLWRNFYEATKGATPEVKSEARKKLAGTLGMTALFSGVMGLPLMTLMFTVANAMHAMFGDDDEPWDAETEFRNFLTDYLGEDFGRIAQVGPTQALTGIGISDRTKLDQLWFRPPDRELEGRAMADYILEQVAGPVAGIGVNSLRALDLANDGHLMRAVETAMPKAVKDGIKSVRYATEGVNDLRGNPVVSDPSPFELAMQLTGWTPARVAEQYQVNNALKQYEQHILNRRKALLNGYAMAMQLRDADAVREASAKIEAFNRTNPEIGISASTIRRSLIARARYNERAVDGLVLNRKLDQRVRESVSFGDDED